MPCESWPARLALTQPTATASASSGDAPAARSSAAPILTRRSASTVGITHPLRVFGSGELSPPAGQGDSVTLKPHAAPGSAPNPARRCLSLWDVSEGRHPSTIDADARRPQGPLGA